MNKQPLSSVIPFQKFQGETPLEALTRLKTEQPELQHETLSYAGRLDPMAEGLLLVLVGEENKNREKYLNLPKTYEAEILFGVETDTYDVLGKIVAFKPPIFENEVDIHNFENNITTNLEKHIGTFQQAYPPYSSKPVNGKPLFIWARENKLHEIEIPTHEVTIMNAQLKSLTSISTEMVLENILQKISKVKGDFRQQEITQIWKSYMQEQQDYKWHIAKIEITCSSGTYIRSIIHELGQYLNCAAICYALKRTYIGEFHG